MCNNIICLMTASIIIVSVCNKCMWSCMCPIYYNKSSTIIHIQCVLYIYIYFSLYYNIIVSLYWDWSWRFFELHNGVVIVIVFYNYTHSDQNIPYVAHQMLFQHAHDTTWQSWNSIQTKYSGLDECTVAYCHKKKNHVSVAVIKVITGQNF